MTFSDLKLPQPLLDAIEETGYREPTPIQARAIPVIMRRKDVIGIAQTGTGKTAAFTLPMLSILGNIKPKAPGIRALIISPTRELVTQIRDNIQDYSRHMSIQLAAVYGGVGEQPQIEALRHADIVIATPGRLIDLMDQGHLDMRGLEILVMDEADRMLDMGFLPAMRKLAKKMPNDRQTLLFSATLSGQIEKLTREFQKKPTLVEVGDRTDPAKTVRQCVYQIPRHLKFPLLLHLFESPELFTVLVFVKMKHSASRLAKQLSQSGVPAEAIHGDRTQNQRQRALDKFKEGKLRVLVGTDVAARGIDITGVTHVVNFDFPLQNEDYIHRIGRTGRAKAEGDAITFVTEHEHRSLNELERFIKRDIPRKHAKDFDYDVPAPVRDGAPRPKRNNDRTPSRPAGKKSTPNKKRPNNKNGGGRRGR
ncbi:DEAD/DEAH box helicase [bacterium]|nr:DEAD/DEAH box helicase [Akkermansiaceae bacterium]MDA8980692.1 DEAD/DEAH box helicase [bacterium]MDA7519110.1 DEAD/DEAH box helicase [Akkermansiaceae bacterium]MDB4142687.1 DEAD/DEAH box helicase [Akkermansiaceae bacterium]MDB4258409.1 DEAD/DEAH box helicase [Akkermansiaceae bacterium]